MQRNVQKHDANFNAPRQNAMNFHCLLESSLIFTPAISSCTKKPHLYANYTAEKMRPFCHNTSSLWGQEKWLPFRRRYFKMHLREWKIFEFQIISHWHVLGSIWEYVMVGWDNGLAPNMRQVIIWTNDGLVYWCTYASLGLNEFKSAMLHIW